LHDQRPNPYATEAESESDPFSPLLSRFAIDFEKMYIQWLYEVLDFTEQRKQQQEAAHDPVTDPNT
jgi:hypothetical protein